MCAFTCGPPQPQPPLSCPLPSFLSLSLCGLETNRSCMSRRGIIDYLPSSNAWTTEGGTEASDASQAPTHLPVTPFSFLCIGFLHVSSEGTFSVPHLKLICALRTEV